MAIFEGRGKVRNVNSKSSYDDFLFVEIGRAWRFADVLTVKEAACILGYEDPAKYTFNNNALPKEAEGMRLLLERAITQGNLRFAAAWEYFDGCNGPESTQTVNAHTFLADCTTIRVSDLTTWCDSKGIEHPFAAQPANNANAPTPIPQTYPDELRVAIEAFQAVSADPSATKTQTPKAALTAWLEKNKPELSANARERIATVANWQPQGGAPRTPGA